MKSQELNYSLFQFFPENNYPLAITCDLAKFDPHLIKRLTSCGAILISDSQKKLIEFAQSNRRDQKILTIKEGTPKVLLQIGKFMEGDKYGHESVVPHSTHNVYRYKGRGLMIFSLQSKEWELGVLSHFGSPQHKSADLTILNRFLALALAPLKIAGFWGLPNEEGIVVTNQSESMGEAVFIDLQNNCLLFQDKKIKPQFPLTFFRYDPQSNNQNPKMTKEELYTFLLTKNVFFNYGGTTALIKQNILSISQMAEGYRTSQEFKGGRTSLQV